MLFFIQKQVQILPKKMLKVFPHLKENFGCPDFYFKLLLFMDEILHNNRYENFLAEYPSCSFVKTLCVPSWFFLPQRRIKEFHEGAQRKVTGHEKKSNYK